ncbi:acyltransferase [Halorientalis halophila]|uniref:acyltransferase n=1 Tax=Halorientalis halophila TaxID=3108499 RepID=UPI003008DE7C
MTDESDPGSAGAGAADGDVTGGAEGDTGRPGRHEATTVHATGGPKNSLQHWLEARNPLVVCLNYAVIVLARIAPSLRLKSWLLRRIGVTVGEGVSWGLESTPDVFWPELITVEDHAIVGYDATLLCHEFLQDEYRTGEIVVRERAMIGAGAIVLPGVEIGAGAQVAANSLVTEDVPPETTVAGVPAEEV